MTNNVDAARWMLGLTLEERLQLPLAWGTEVDPSRQSGNWPWRLQKWLEAPLFADSEELCNHWETTFGSARACAAACLADADQLRPHAQKVPWARKLSGLLADAETAEATPDPFLREFASVALPLAHAALERVRLIVHDLSVRYPYVPTARGVIEAALLEYLARVVSEHSIRVMILEVRLSVAGCGDTTSSEERYRKFFDDFERSPRRQAQVLRDYPVLARDLLACVEAWETFAGELLTAWYEDFEEITPLFQHPRHVGAISRIEFGAGDRHRNGRCVAIVHTDDGGRIVYKPRACAVDATYSRLLENINRWGLKAPLRVPAVVSRERHAWWEFIDFGECTSRSDADAFYRRLGVHLALLHILDGVDCHLENLIAAGPHPVVIDLEGLFHPIVRGQPRPSVRDGQTAALLMRESVLRVGLLPHNPVKGADGLELSYDVSGITGEPGQLTPFSVLRYEQAGTDKMRAVETPYVVPGAANRPRLAGQPVRASEHVEALVEGFQEAGAILIAHKEDLLRPNGLLSAFEDVEVRVILRPTRKYGQLLTACFHPDMLQNAIDRDRLLARLWNAAEGESLPRRAVLSEIRDLERGDIPLFVTRPASTSIWTSDGEEIRDALTEPSAASVRRRIEVLDDAAVQRQSWFVRAAMATISGQHGIASAESDLDQGAVETPRTDFSFLDASREIAHTLERLAISDSEGVTWIGLSLRHQRRWSVEPVPSDLYQGLAGIAFFLAYLGHVGGVQSPEHLARRVALQLTAECKAALEDGNTPFTEAVPIGAFEGLGAYIYLFAHLGVLWRDDAYIDLANRLGRALRPLVHTDERLDVVSGSAGCILSLLALNSVAPDAQIVDVARACGQRLVDAAIPCGAGIGWRTKLPAERPLLGLSHGAGGIALALTRLGHATGELRFLDAASRAVRYENGEYEAHARKWPDYRVGMRVSGAEVGPICAWCHGAAGIAIGRLAMLQTIPAMRETEELKDAVRATIEGGFGGNDCLCHGNLGNLEAVLEAERALLLPNGGSSAHDFGRSLVARSRTRQWTCGVPTGLATPGLMTGLAGIGYGLLRLSAPDHVPSVLSVAGPVTEQFET